MEGSKSTDKSNELNYQLLIKPEAEEDIQEIFDWYEGKLPGLGNYFLHEFDQKLNLILSHPEGFQVHYKEFRFAFLKRFPISIHFLIENNTIYIFGIFPTNANPEKWR